ncbi:MAG: DUF4342 domain-containing protein [Balneolaceae bacterium]
MTTSGTTIIEEIKGTASEMIRQVKELIREGNARRLVIQNKNGKILFQSQLTAGVAGTALFVTMAPIISAITLFVLFANDVKVLVEKDIDSEEEEREAGKNRDENEIEAEFIPIHDDEETEEEPEEDKSSSDEKTNDEDNNDAVKTVGKV